MSNKKVENKDINYHLKHLGAAIVGSAFAGGVGYIGKELTKLGKKKIDKFFGI